MRTLLCLGLLAGATTFTALPAADPQPAKKPVYEKRRVHDPEGTGIFYLGREIAPVMGFQGAGWLERDEREKEEAPSKLLPLLGLKPGMTVADVGAGSGYHVFRMAPIVGEKGAVLAVDVQQEMLDLIAERMKKEKVTNIKLIKGTEKDPKLPAGEVDRILMVDVYHEFTNPYEMTEKMIAALKPGGKLIFVEFRLEDPKVPIKLVHKMTERQVIREMAEFPDLEHETTIKSLPWQHVIVFQKNAKK
jgi:precorrin-6B methylase 2